MGTETIVSRAPTRIDLAGGTLDLWPLYLFLDHPITINLGIDLFAEARIESLGDDAGIVLRSEDQGIEARFQWNELAKAQVSPALELHLKLLRFFARDQKQKQSLRLTTKAKSPAGAGLGGSSTLSVALIGALASWARGKIVAPLTEGENFIEIVRDVESTVIQVPAGLQDYYGAMYGGLQSLQWGFGSHERRWLSQEILTELEQRLLLFYSGQSRNSGINNWVLYKGFIDRQPGLRQKFEKIAAATKDLESALEHGDWQAVGQAISEEWETRQTLANGISTPEIGAAFAAAKKIAPVTGKICGAGGGGCFFLYLPEADPDVKEAIQKSLSNEGIRPLPFKAVPHGLEIQRA